MTGKALHRITLHILAFILFSNSLYAQVAPDSCWAFSIDGIDVYAQRPNIAKAVTVSDGFVICGSGYRQIFPNLHGPVSGRTSWGGVYVAKYDFTGKLIWLDYGINPTFSSVPWSSITLTADANDNIYICGRLGIGASFYYNAGASSCLITATDSLSSPGASYIAKLNKDGQVIWHSSVALDEPTNITWAPNNQVIVAGSLQTDDAVYIKDSVVDTTFRNMVPFSTYNRMQFLYWLDSSGHLLKHTRINEFTANYRGVMSMATDAESNLVLCGQYEQVLSLPAVSGTDSIYFDHNKSGPRFYAVKYDTAGTPLWLVQDRMSFSSSDHSGSMPSCITTGSDGTIYVATASSWHWYPTVTSTFYNSDSSATPVPHGPWIIYSINKNGFLNWSAGGNYSTSGGIYIKDGIITSAASSNDANPTFYNDTIYAANGPNLYFPVSGAGFFIASFDTTGKILGAAKAGYSNGPMMYSTFGVIPGKATGYSIVYNDAKKYNGTDSIVVFSDTLDFNETDGFVASFGPGGCDDLPAPPSTVAVNSILLSSLSCYPNPVTVAHADEVTVEGNDAIGSVAMYNLLGVECGRWNDLNKNIVHLGLGNLPAGMYILKCRDQDGKDMGIIKLILQ